jgi:hypothetical protein
MRRVLTATPHALEIVLRDQFFFQCFGVLRPAVHLQPRHDFAWYFLGQAYVETC